MNEVYEQMMIELRYQMDDLERRVFQALREHPEGMRRPQLVAYVFRQTRSSRTINNDTQDRKVRKAIESLRLKGVPIISTSGRPGYRLDASEKAKREMMAELISRRDRLNELIRTVSNFKSVPEKIPQKIQPKLI